MAALAGILAVVTLAGGCQNLFFDPASVPLRSGGAQDVDGNPGWDTGGPVDSGTSRPADAATGGPDSAYVTDTSVRRDPGADSRSDGSGDTGGPLDGGADADSDADTAADSDTGAVEPRDTGGRDVADTAPPPADPYACFEAVSCVSLNCPNYRQSCRQTYDPMVSAARRSELVNLVGCLRANSCDFIAKPACVDSRCATQRDRCLEDAPSSGTIKACAGFFRCADACRPYDSACYKACQTRLGFLARKQYDRLANCLKRKCGNADARSSCARQKCKSEYEDCMGCP